MKTKKLFSLLLALILVISVLALSGCGNSGSPSDDVSGGEPQDQGGEAPSTDDTVYELSVSIIQPVESAIGSVVASWCEKIQADSNGRLKLTLYPSGTLLPVTDTLTGVQNALADIAFLPSNIATDYLPVNTQLLCMPFMDYPSLVAAYEIYNQLREQYPEIDAEYAGQGLVNLGAYFMGRNDIYFAGKEEVRTPEDIKGMKIGASSAFVSSYLTALGAAPVFITNADLFTSLDNGVVQGVIQHINLIKSTGSMEAVESAAMIGTTGILRDLGIFIMNAESFSALPEDLRTQLSEGFKGLLNELVERESADREVFLGQLKEGGCIVTELTDEEAAAWAKYADGIHEEVISNLEGQGIGAQAIYDAVMSLNESY